MHSRNLKQGVLDKRIDALQSLEASLREHRKTSHAVTSAENAKRHTIEARIRLRKQHEQEERARTEQKERERVQKEQREKREKAEAEARRKFEDERAAELKAQEEAAKLREEASKKRREEAAALAAEIHRTKPTAYCSKTACTYDS